MPNPSDNTRLAPIVNPQLIPLIQGQVLNESAKNKQTSVSQKQKVVLPTEPRKEISFFNTKNDLLNFFLPHKLEDIPTMFLGVPESGLINKLGKTAQIVNTEKGLATKIGDKTYYSLGDTPPSVEQIGNSVRQTAPIPDKSINRVQNMMEVSNKNDSRFQLAMEALVNDHLTDRSYQGFKNLDYQQRMIYPMERAGFPNNFKVNINNLPKNEYGGPIDNSIVGIIPYTKVTKDNKVKNVTNYLEEIRNKSLKTKEKILNLRELIKQ